MLLCDALWRALPAGDNCIRICLNIAVTSSPAGICGVRIAEVLQTTARRRAQFLATAWLVHLPVHMARF